MLRRISLLALGVAAAPFVAGSPLAPVRVASSAAPLDSSLETTAVSAATPEPTSASASAASAAPSLNIGNHPLVRDRLCGTAPPSAALLQHHAHLQAAQAALRERASPSATKFTVQVHFHVVSTAAQAGQVTHAMVANQFGALQAAYGPAGITFALASVDYTVNDSWATDGADAAMKSALRAGGYQALNVYFQTALSADGSGSAAAQLLGFCTLPTNVTYVPCGGCAPQAFPAADWAGDGCNVHAGSMPGGWLAGYNLGRTAVHEAGHWFGLLHVFQDTTCNPGDPGDYIADTPQQATSSQGCPAGKNSCPTCPGYDAIHNYMDYSDDACYERFSADQILRMQNMFVSLRQGH